MIYFKQYAVMTIDQSVAFVTFLLFDFIVFFCFSGFFCFIFSA